ncbi:hypothetical protein ACFL96_20110 [Thermoproteota archaeon]
MEKLPNHTKSNLCQMPDLGISCVGCCGRIIHRKPSVEEALKKNTIEHKHKSDIKEFIWRHPPNDLRACGICPNLVKDDVRKGKVFCPAHPERNQGIDHRDGYCDTLHLCKTAFLFDLWEKDLQKRFIAFIKHKVRKKQLDWYSYSIEMDNDGLLIEFEESPFWHR